MQQPLKILLYVQNLLGIGHLRRAGALASGMTRAGHEVIFVSGGMPVPGIDMGGARLVQLPPVRAKDHTFKILVDNDDREIDDAFRDDRRDRLLAEFDGFRPDVVLTELFPFGRRQMRFELLPLLDRAKTADWGPKIVSSMRDILVTKPRMDRNLEIVETIEKYYDLCLVHGDEKVIALSDTFPLYDRIADKIAYTGYVVNPAGDDDEGGDIGAGEVVVSAGGGAVGYDFMPKIFEMRGDLPFAERRWRFLTGPHMDDKVFAAMSEKADERTLVERSRPNLPAILKRAHLSISQAGYNTVMELLSVDTPSVVIPFEGGVETEQRLRADLLAGKGQLQVVSEDSVTLETVSAAMREAIGQFEDRDGDLGVVALDGADRTAKIISDLVARP